MKTRKFILRAGGLASFILAIALLWPALVVDAAEQAGNRARYVAFEPVSVTVLNESRVAGFLAVTFSLEASDAEQEETITEMKPRLRDAIIRRLSRLAGTRIEVTRPLNIALVNRQIQSVVDEVLGDKTAEVLIQSASIQRM